MDEKGVSKGIVQSAQNMTNSSENLDLKIKQA
jgi:hypothetical protein